MGQQGDDWDGGAAGDGWWVEYIAKQFFGDDGDVLSLVHAGDVVADGLRSGIVQHG